MEDSKKLYEVSLIALQEYLALAQDESLLIVTDENKLNIGQAFLEAGHALCQDAYLIEMKSRKNDGEEPPELVAEMMKSVDVVVCPTTKSITHTEARRNASKLGIRVATLPGIEPDTLIRCINSEIKKVVDTSEKVAANLRKANQVRILTEEGTDISFSIKDRKVYLNTGMIHNIGESGNLPAGVVYVAPVEDSLNGTIVFDGSFANHGVLEEPVKITVADGVATRFSGKTNAKQISSILKKFGDNALRIGEFGIGTNHTAIISGNIIEDEKAVGVIHFSFGSNVALGGKINVPIHLKGTIRNADVYLDKKPLLITGRFILL